MEKELYEYAIHRPLPEVLVGFPESDRIFALTVMRQAKVFMAKKSIANDGFTDSDRAKVLKAKRILFDWKAIVMMASDIETEKAKKILKEEINRVVANCQRQKKLQYKG